MKTKILFLFLIFTALTFTSCLKDEVYEGPPVLSDLTITPQAPGDNDAVTVSVIASDMNGVKAVTLYYKVDNGSFTSLTMTSSGTKTYTAQIPKQDVGKTVFYYAEAENNSGQKSTIPDGAPESTAAYTVGAPSIVMNEVYSRGTPDAPDWIEIYNNSDSPADISGFKVYDGGGLAGTKPKKEIPAGTILPGEAFM